MILFKQNFELLSKKPMWTFGEDNEPIMVENIYDDLEVIRIYRSNIGIPDKYYDIPIEKITMVMELGTFFFKTKRDCKKFSKLAASDQGRLCILENSFECAKRNNYIIKFKEEKPVKDGLYVIKDFENALFSFCEIKDLVYINDHNEICNFEIADEVVEDYLIKYISTIDISSRHDLHYERVIFEIYTENKKVYINHMYVRDVGITKKEIFFFSRILNYPILGTREAKIFLINNDINEYIDNKQKEQIDLRIFEEERERKRNLKATIINLCRNYIWEHKFEVFQNISKIIKFIKNINNVEEPEMQPQSA